MTRTDGEFHWDMNMITRFEYRIARFDCALRVHTFAGHRALLTVSLTLTCDSRTRKIELFTFHSRIHTDWVRLGLRHQNELLINRDILISFYFNSYPSFWGVWDFVSFTSWLQSRGDICRLPIRFVPA